jgi:hypothetical protein
VENATLALSAVYLKSHHGYVGFIAELPEVTSYGATLEQAREMLRQLTLVAWDEARRGTAELLADKEVVRELFTLECRPLWLAGAAGGGFPSGGRFRAC